MVPPKKIRHWLVGIAAGGIFGPSGPLRLGGNMRVILGYVRPDDPDHLGISLEPEVMWAANGEPANQKSSAFLFSLPVLASVNVFAGPGLLRVLVGPTFDYDSLRESLGKFTDAGASIGLEAGAAYLFNLPVGALGLDLRFHYLPYVVHNSTDNAYLITVGVSYVDIL